MGVAVPRGQWWSIAWAAFFNKPALSMDDSSGAFKDLYLFSTACVDAIFLCSQVGYFFVHCPSFGDEIVKTRRAVFSCLMCRTMKLVGMYLFKPCKAHFFS